MKKNIINELNQMKYLFGYQKGRVISEQKKRLKEDEYDEDIIFADPEIMDPEVMPDTDRDVKEKPYRPGRPDRDPNRLPYTDPDTHPQGEFEDLEIDFGPEVAPTPTREKERTKERETEKPYRPGRPDRDPNRLPYTDPDTHPQGSERHYDSESDTFEGGDRALESLVMKYLKNRN